jgi:hypothetical protein
MRVSGQLPALAAFTIGKRFFEGMRQISFLMATCRFERSWTNSIMKEGNYVERQYDLMVQLRVKVC